MKRRRYVPYLLSKDDVVIDIGLNDGTLLGNFKDGGHRVLGIEPTNAGKIARKKGITTDIAFFNKDYALLFSWHIADELIPKLKARGFSGKFIVPLPEPHVVG